MIDSNHTQSTSGIESACIPSNVFFELWERTSSTLTEKELEWFSRSTEYAEMMLRNLRDTMEGIGCLVASDTKENNAYPAGNFQSNSDVPTLLFSLANSIDSIQGMIHVGTSADDRLRNPELYHR